MKRITGAQYIAELVKGYGISHVFFVPAILSTALVEMESLGIRRIVPHSEKAAVYMADGYARIHGGPALCMSQSVGAANLAAGLQDPFLAHSPVIAITGRKPARARYRNAYQEIEHRRLFDSVTKYNVEVDEVEQLPHLFPQAFREAVSAVPGPVHLELVGYEGDAICRAEADLDLVIEKEYAKFPPFRPQPPEERLQEALRKIRTARRPVFVAGRGVIMSGASEELTAFAERIQVPVATSVDAKTAIRNDNPLSIGCVGSYARPSANQIVSEADLVIFIGTGAGDQVTNNWTLPMTGVDVIQIDINPVELGRNYPGTYGILADARLCLQRFTELTAKPAGEKSDWVKRIREIAEGWEQEAEGTRNSEAEPILTERLCREIEGVLPDEAILVADTGFSAVWSAVHIALNSPRQSYIRAAGTLGWAFPAALGARCAAPQRPVVCFTGDGGFMYHLPELETARRWNLSVVIIVNNNSMFSQSIRGVNRAYGDRPGEKSDIYGFTPLNFARIAESFGCRGLRVEEPGAIRVALEAALQSNQPVVVDVVTDGQHPAPWAKPVGKTFPMN